MFFSVYSYFILFYFKNILQQLSKAFFLLLINYHWRVCYIYDVIMSNFVHAPLYGHCKVINTVRWGG